MCLRANRVAARDWNQPDFLRFRDEWVSKLANNQLRRGAIEVLYQDSMARMANLEAKGVGILQAASIVAAGILVAFTGPNISVVLGAFGLVYVTAAAVACCSVLTPRMRYQLTLNEVASDGGGYPEMAAAIKTMEPVGLRASNLVTSAIYDLIRAMTLALAALVALTVIGHSTVGNTHPTPTPLPSATSPTPQSSPIHPTRTSVTPSITH